MTTASFSPLQQPLRGLHAIEASAGTGKTYSITLLWLRLLLEESLPIERILVCTFTRAATAELRERLRAALDSALTTLEQLANGAEPDGDIARLLRKLCPAPAAVESAATRRDLAAALSRAQSAFDLAPISTIHGFCHALVTRHSLELGGDSDAELVESADDLLAQLVVDTLIQHAHSGMLNRNQALAVARCLVSEVGMDRADIALPSLHGDGSEQQLRIAHEKLAAMRHAAAQKLLLIKSRAKIAAAGTALIDSLLAGAPGCHEQWLTGPQEKALAEHYPELLQALQELRQAYQDRQHRIYHALADAALERFAVAKEQAQVRSYDDLLLSVRAALRGPQGPALATAIGERFQAVMIDECQDSDRLQIEVLQNLFSRGAHGATAPATRSFLVIGDPKQSIYRFRGADLSSYRALSQQATKAPEMRHNWRSDEALIATLNDCYERHCPQFHDSASNDPIPYIPVSAQAPWSRLLDPDFPGTGAARQQALVTLWCPVEQRGLADILIARQVASECARLLQGRVQIRADDQATPQALGAGDMAVIAHRHADLHLVARELRRRGIPAQFAGRGLGSVLDGDEAMDVAAWLAALAECETGGSNALGRLAMLLSTPLYGASSQEVQRLAGSPSQLAALADDCRRQAEALRRWGPLPALLRLLQQPARQTEILAYASGERRLTNWRHLGEILQAAWATGNRDPLALGQTLARLQAEARDQAESAMERLETDLPAVQLVTLHGSKGLEYPIVFCPGLWHVPSRMKRKQRTTVAIVRDRKHPRLDLIGAPEFEQQREVAMQQEDEEGERLLYVALTRARHRCYVGLAPVPDGNAAHANGAARSPLARLWGLAEQPTSDWPASIATFSPLITTYEQPAAGTETSPQRPAAEKYPSLATAPTMAANLAKPYQTGSFSGLKRRSNDSALARDRDQDGDEDSDQTRDPGLLAGLGSGVRLGNRIHDLLEEILGNRQELDQLLPALTSDASSEQQQQRQTLRQALHCLTTQRWQLHSADEVSLIELRGQALAEMHFLLPVQHLGPARLSQALLKDTLIHDNPQRRDWAQRIAGWSFDALQGFVQGYIDLIFCHQGRWYIADYKTNLLADYAPAQLEETMLQSHYLLQSRLYLVALHRHLRHHLDGYDPATHLGGAVYLFVRGFPKQGLWQDGFDTAGLLALDQALAEAAP